MGFIILTIFIIIILVGHINDYDDRKECQRNANNRGEKIYRDNHGAWWVGNRKCIDHWENGRHILTYANDRTTIIKDYTAEENAKVNAEINVKKDKVKREALEAKANGKKFIGITIDMVYIEYEIDVDRFYIVVRDLDRYMKAYYNVLWSERKNEYVCTNVVEITREEADKCSKYKYKVIDGTDKYTKRSDDIPNELRLTYYKAKEKMA